MKASTRALLAAAKAQRIATPRGSRAAIETAWYFRQYVLDKGKAATRRTVVFNALQLYGGAA
jgi:hypothetical protein